MKTLLTLLVLSLLAGCAEELVCPQGETACGGTCVSLLSDARNCGACGAAVGRLEVCAAAAPACAADVGVCGGACTDLARDPANCGACGNACGATQLCTTDGAGTSCRDACPEGFTACAGACVDLLGDRFHCGGCGGACAAGQICHQGACRSDMHVACYATNEVVPVMATLAPAGEARETPAGPASLAVSGDAIYVANVDGFANAYLSVLPLGAVPPPRHVQLSGFDLQQIVAHQDVLLLTNAAIGTLLILDSSGGVLDEIAMPAQQTFPNPHGLAVSGTNAYVALYGSDATNGQSIAKVDLSGLAACTAAPGTVPCGDVVGELDLLAIEGTSDAPGLPFPSAAAAAGGRVYVTLSNLEEDVTPFGTFFVKPAGDGKLAVVDASADDALSIVNLPGCGNPGALALAGTTLWVACGSFSYPDLAPSALIPVDVGASPPAVGALLPLPGIVPGKVAFCAGMGYVTDQASGAVLRFAPDTRAVEDPVTVCPVGPFGFAWAADVACSG